jgi:hypothetical protein
MRKRLPTVMQRIWTIHAHAPVHTMKDDSPPVEWKLFTRK